MMLRALRRCRATSGMTLIELMVVLGIIGLLFGLAVTSLRRARLAANEVNAMGALRTITKAEFAYAVACGHGDYATSLVILGTKPPGSIQAYLNPDLGSSDTVTRDGYTVTLRVGLDSSTRVNDCMGRPTSTTYYATAFPADPGKSGMRAFATNQGAAIWQRFSALPPTEPFGPPSEIAR
jgi:prepilin-type N-terminal cleavage/methylation domain-containing protein